MKQKNKFLRLEARRDNHPSGKGYEKKVAGCSLTRVSKSKNYEHNVSRLLQDLRHSKSIIINDTGIKQTIRVSQNYDVQVDHMHIYVGLGKDIGHKTMGKLDFLKNKYGFMIFGFNDIK